ncbi:hypothetical protein AJ80_09099 [Polytolypa hystricis UAMH7299]|uniref:FAD linked oxidase N-terminal domain-containing protein n=1 Tax=Polytolypa hystricis (strain UAMH7299) TaxID=1447883 RepID=A0A2B7WWK5_POLH7|nr:hypothetical protein AJ80_09099 [Polytolypa hystricis UAMH7299]
MVAGGRDSNVGVGGLILGGGCSWFASKMGFVADSVLNVELVTADGSIINVNANEHSDLFVGLKGGGNNFGIATRFDLKAFEFEKMWGGLKTYSNETTDAQIQAFIANIDTHASLINYYMYDQRSGTHTVTNVMHYNFPVANAPIYDEINAIPGVLADTTRTVKLSKLTEELSSETQRSRNFFVTLTFANDAAMYRKAIDISNSQLKPFLNIDGLVWSVLVQPIPATVREASQRSGPNLLGLDRAHGNLAMYLLYAAWSDPADDERMIAAGYSAIDEIKSESVRTGKDSPFIYMDYAGEHQDVLRGYGEASVQKMKELSAKYDPSGVFQTLVSGGWKIGSTTASRGSFVRTDQLLLQWLHGWSWP